MHTGNVWFDHPAVNKVGCYTRATLHALRDADLALPSPLYDWPDFDASVGVCLRLSSAAFSHVEAELRLSKSNSGWWGQG